MKVPLMIAGTMLLHLVAWVMMMIVIKLLVELWKSRRAIAKHAEEPNEAG